jgi:hypothetical protein
LHGALATDLSQQLGNEYQILSQGFEGNKEGTISGRYFDKRVDITISHKNKVIAGVGVKFVMQNYSQNSNNYFENMLGETANIRSNGIPYFQILIIFDKLPYYTRENTIAIWETFSLHNASKYITMSKDKIDTFFHTPNKMLIYVVHIPENESLRDKETYMKYYKSRDFELEVYPADMGDYGEELILNDYERFRDKLYHTIKAL